MKTRTFFRHHGTLFQWGSTVDMKCLIDRVACKAGLLHFLQGLSLLDGSLFISFLYIPLFRYPLF